MDFYFSILTILVDFLALVEEIALATFRIYLGVGLGILYMKFNSLKKRKDKFVSITINFFTPYLILVSMLNVSFGEYWIFPIIAGLLVTFIGILMPSLIASLKNQPKPDPAELSTAAFSNAVNYPLPIIYSLTPEGLGIASLFIATSIVMRNTVGFWISGHKMTMKDIKEILLFPPIWGILIGLTLNAIDAKSSVLEYSNSLIGSALFELGIIMTLMTVGFGLQDFGLKYKTELLRVGFTRFIVSLILALGLVIAFQLQPIVAVPIIVQMAAPPAVYNGLYAERFGQNTEMTSNLIVSLTFVALIFLPLEIALIILFIL